jgi:CRP-like cAMP-binding protein
VRRGVPYGFVVGKRYSRRAIVPSECLIERGWILITSIAAGGREIVLGLRGPGDVIGDRSVLDGAPRSATALAVGEVQATVAPSSALTRALSDAGTAMDLLRVLASRLRDADRKRLEFAALDTLGRVAWRLQELSERFGEQTAEGIEVQLPLSGAARQLVRRVARGHGKGARGAPHAGMYCHAPA